MNDEEPHAKQRTAEGPKLGIIAIDSATSLLPGSPCNAASYSVPVDFELAQGATGDRCLDGDPGLLAELQRAASALEQRGARVIGSNCGYLARYQAGVADAVGVPVFLSPLLLLPVLSSIVRSKGKIGIVTYAARGITRELVLAAGYTGDLRRLVVAGVDHTPAWAVLNAPSATLQPDAMKRDLEVAVAELLACEPEIAALLFECTTMSVFTPSISRRVALPIFDNTALLNTMIGSLAVAPYVGIEAPPPAARLQVAATVGDYPNAP